MWARIAAQAVLVAVSLLVATTWQPQLEAHMVVHVVLADVVAGALVLLVPTAMRRSWSHAIDEAVGSRRAGWRVAWMIRSPVAILGAWTATLTYLMSPHGHRWATAGTEPFIEALLLITVGALFWRATLDEHEARALPTAIVHGGLRWWGRHVFAMAGRVSILPAIIMVWYAPHGSYAGADREDQVAAASVVLGAEMALFGGAVVLFLLLAVRSGWGGEDEVRVA